MAIDLSSNELDGQIPQVVRQRSSLEVLNFSHDNIIQKFDSSWIFRLLQSVSRWEDSHAADKFEFYNDSDIGNLGSRWFPFS